MEIIEKGLVNVKFADKDLQKATDAIIKLGKKVASNLYETAHIIAEVDEKKLYIADGFKTVHEWTNTAFGIAKSASYNMLRIGRDFTTPVFNENAKVTGYGSSLYKMEFGNTDYTVSQITHMFPLDNSLIQEINDDGIINPDMTIKEIDAIVKKYKDSEPEETTDDPEPEDTTDIEPDEPETMIVTDDDGIQYEIPVEILRQYIIK